MIHIYYLIGIFGILWELYNLYFPRKVAEFLKGIKNKPKEQESSSIQKAYYYLMSGYMIWILVGMVTSNWFIFLTLFVLGILNLRRSVVGTWLRAFISLVLIFFAILNNYHFHIDVFNLLMSKIIN